MRIYFASDIHYEFGGVYAPPPTILPCDVIVLAGDLCPVLVWDNYPLDELFYSLSEVARGVIFVAGNHEFYRNSIEETFVFLREKFASYPENVHFLENSTVTINGVTFGGSVFWTDMKNDDPIVKLDAREAISDYSVIRYNNRALRPEDTVEFNRTAREWLSSSLDLIDVMITHHLPLPVKYKDQEINNITYMYCNTRLDQLITMSRIKYWIHGHSHQSYDIKIHQTRVVSNPYGYYTIPHDRNEEYTNDKYVYF